MRQYSEFDYQAVLILVSFGILILIVWAAWQLLVGWRERRARDERMRRNQLDAVDPPRIEPPRVHDAVARVRIEPDPMNYRSSIRVIEGVSEDPFEAVEPPPKGANRQTQ